MLEDEVRERRLDPAELTLLYWVSVASAYGARLDMNATARAPISRPPRDGRRAFVRSPDAISVELLQRGEALPPAEPWASMANTGEW